MLNPSKEYFVILYQSEIEMMENPNHTAVYFAIKSYTANGKNSVGLSIRDIASRARTSIGTVYATIPWLINRNLIAIVGEEKRRGGSVHVYKVFTRRTVNESKRSVDEQLNDESVQLVKESVQSSGTNLTQYKNINKKESYGFFSSKDKAEQVWDTYSSELLDNYGISDPSLIEKTKKSFLLKVKYPSQETLQAWIKSASRFDISTKDNTDSPVYMTDPLEKLKERAANRIKELTGRRPEYYSGLNCYYYGNVTEERFDDIFAELYKYSPKDRIFEDAACAGYFVTPKPIEEEVFLET